MNIFLFEDYKTFLKAYIEDQPKKGRGILSRWSELLNIKSSFLGQVLNSEKHLSLEHAHALGLSLNLTPLDLGYFIGLVSRERAGNFELKEFYSRQLNQMRNQAMRLNSHLAATRELSSEEMATYYSRWIYSAIRIYTSIGKGKTITDICERFQITRLFAESLLKFLCENGICKKQADTYSAGAQRLMVHKGDSNYFRHQANWRLQSIQKCMINSDSDLFITSPLSLSLKDYQELRAQILEFTKSISKKVEDTQPEEAYCLNIDIFKI